MKKIISFVLALILIFGTVCVASSEQTTIPTPDFAGKTNPARFLKDDGNTVYHAAHLTLHIGSKNCKVSADSVEVRDQIGSGTLLGHLEQADTFTLDEINGNWAKITVTRPAKTSRDSYEGMSGWVDADYMECPCSLDEYSSGRAHTVYSIGAAVKKGVNLRKNPSKESSLFASLKKGEQVEILSEYTGKDGKVWYRCRYQGKMGYIRSDMLEIAEKDIPEGIAQAAVPDGQANPDENTLPEEGTTAEDAPAYDHSWQKVYYDFILAKQYMAAQDPSEPEIYYDAFGNPYEINPYKAVAFGLYDWDQDGIPELFADNGAPDDGWSSAIVYAWSDGQIRSIGVLANRSGGPWITADAGYPGVLTESGNMGSFEMEYTLLSETGAFLSSYVYHESYNDPDEESEMPLEYPIITIQTPDTGLFSTIQNYGVIPICRYEAAGITEDNWNEFVFSAGADRSLLSPESVISGEAVIDSSSAGEYGLMIPSEEPQNENSSRQEQSTETAEWKEAYRQFISERKYFEHLVWNDPRFIDHDTSYSGAQDCYALHDLNLDGIPELLVCAYLDYEQDNAFTFENGAVKFLGCIGGDLDKDSIFYFNDLDYPGLFLTTGSWVTGIWHYSMESNVFTETDMGGTVIEEGPDDPYVADIWLKTDDPKLYKYLLDLITRQNQAGYASYLDWSRGRAEALLTDSDWEAFYASATAQTNALQANSPETGFPAGTEEETAQGSGEPQQDWIAAYGRFVLNEEYKSFGQIYYGNIWLSMFDLDGNGIPELLLYNGSDEESTAGTYVYTWSPAAGVVYVDEIFINDYYIGEAISQHPEKHGLVENRMSESGEAYLLYTMKDNRILTERISDGGWGYQRWYAEEQFRSISWDDFAVNAPFCLDILEVEETKHNETYVSGEPFTMTFTIKGGDAPYHVNYAWYSEKTDIDIERGSFDTNDSSITLTCVPRIHDDTLIVRIDVVDHYFRHNYTVYADHFFEERENAVTNNNSSSLIPYAVSLPMNSDWQEIQVKEDEKQIITGACLIRSGEQIAAAPAGTILGRYTFRTSQGLYPCRITLSKPEIPARLANALSECQSSWFLYRLENTKSDLYFDVLLIIPNSTYDIMEIVYQWYAEENRGFFDLRAPRPWWDFDWTENSLSGMIIEYPGIPDALIDLNGEPSMKDQITDAYFPVPEKYIDRILEFLHSDNPEELLDIGELNMPE